MKTLTTKKQRADFLNENWKVETLTFKWTTSKARETYGYNICTVKDKIGGKIASCSGGGYDMKGTCFADFVQLYFPEEIKKLNSKDFYGVSHYNNKTRKYQKRSSKNTKTYLDGGCGFDCITRILNKIGFSLVYIRETKNETIYLIKL